MITIAIVAAVLVTGLIIVGVVVLRAGIAREEHDRSLLDEPSTLAAAATRRIVGLYVRTPQDVAPADDVAGHAEAGRC